MIKDLIRIFRGVLELELKKGFQDKAVVGGIDAFWSRHKGLVQSKLKDPVTLKAFRNLDIKDFRYRNLDVSARQRWIRSLLQLTSNIKDDSTCNIGQEIKKSTPISPIRVEQQKNYQPSYGLNASLTILKGIGQSLAKKFNKLGVDKIIDMIYFFPRRHIDYSQLKPISSLETGKEQTITGIIWEARETRIGQRRGTEAIVGDDTGNIRVVWFNQPYLARKLKTNERILLSGRVSLFKGRRQMEAPQWDLLNEGENINTGRLVPIYPLTEGLYQRQARNFITTTVRQYSDVVPEFLPTEIKQRQNLIGLSDALLQAHLPDNLEWKDKARKRLAFDELLIFQLGVLGRKFSWQEEKTAPVLKSEISVTEKFFSCLSFKLTPAQLRALEEILKDMNSSKPMCRMLQGDVGSGKTVIAVAALLTAASNNHQGIMMAPTEILAEQHYQTLVKLLLHNSETHSISTYVTGIPGWKDSCSRNLNIALLIGKMPRKEKDKIYGMAKEGLLDIIVGTHALIQEGLELKNLGLAIIDEQHRFGVEQRSCLRQKGFNPHLLVMTATPIPRTLALTFFGDLDLSVLDQMPPGRKPVKTKWLNPEERDKAYSFIQRKIEEGQQAFVICPRIESSDNMDSDEDTSRREIRAAIAEYERLSKDIFPEIRMGLLHGRMPVSDKEIVMRSFKMGEIKILVSTSVVEVGIDVPRATVMLVEGAENFGLSQLHQFRGRIGRGTEQSYCLLLSDSSSPEAFQRLSLMEKIHDGFVLAEEDLKIRGPGEFFGTRQSGMPDLVMAKLSDVALLEKARHEAQELFRMDPHLVSQNNRPLAERVREVWKVQGASEPAISSE